MNPATRIASTRASRPVTIAFALILAIVGTHGVARAGTAGVDGAKTITAAGTVVNGYASLTSATAGGTTVTVASIAGLSPSGLTPLGPGSVILLYQANGATIDDSDDTTSTYQPAYGNVTNGNNAGYYEFTTVGSVSGNTITIAANCAALAHSYSTTATQDAEVVRVPQYSSLTISAGASITAPAWSATENTATGSATYGSTNAGGGYGGIVAIDVAGTTVINGSINVTGDGFLGGDGYQNAGASAPTNPNNHASVTDTVLSGETGGDLQSALAGMKGESIAGNQATYDASFVSRYGRGAPANGGGGGNGHNNGGGGGSNGNNGNTWFGVGIEDPTYANWYSDENGENPLGTYDNGGYTAINTPIAGSPMVNDSGGGRGGYSFSDAPNYPSYDEGGFGGRPLGATANARIFFGGGGGAGDENDNSGGYGGNGGGIVILNTNVLAGSGSIVANGAAGGTPKSSDGAGGGGGGGSVVVLAASGSIATINANGGVGGNMAVSGGGDNEGTGGGGGGGFVAAPATTITVTGGAEGSIATNSPSYKAGFPPYGATEGASGGTATAPTAFTYCFTPTIGLAKAATTVTNNGDGTYNITYTVVAENYGDTPLTGATAQDVLTNTFPSGTTYTIVTQPAITGTTNGATATAATNYDGTAATYLFTAGTFPISNSTTTPTASSVTLTFTVKIKPPSGSQTYNNSATTTGSAPATGYGNANSKTTTDTSENGTNPDPAGDGNPASENVVTPVTVVGQSLLTKTVQNITTGEAAGLTTDTAKPGNVLQYQIAYSNTTGGALTNFVIKDSIPTNTTYVPGSAACPTVPGGITCTPAYTAASGNTAAFVTFTFTGGTLASYTGTGSQIVVKFQVTVN
jgi:uncharacterized repeat protein (TIGR01451 family)